jgi:hypothetical protein
VQLGRIRAQPRYKVRARPTRTARARPAATRAHGPRPQGAGRNVGAEIRRQKKDMIDQIDRLDLLAEQKILTAHETGET